MTVRWAKQALLELSTGLCLPLLGPVLVIGEVCFWWDDNCHHRRVNSNTMWWNFIIHEQSLSSPPSTKIYSLFILHLKNYRLTFLAVLRSKHYSGFIRYTGFLPRSGNMHVRCAFVCVNGSMWFSMWLSEELVTCLEWNPSFAHGQLW